MRSKLFYILLLVLSPCLSAVAQQATDTIAPTMPGKGNLVLRSIFEYYKLKPSEQNQFSGTYLESTVHLDYGLTGDTSLMLHFSEVKQDEENVNSEDGFDDIKITYKWRFYQDDFGPVFHATEGDSVDPVIAGEKDANHLAFNAAYLYRVKPEAYSQELVAAWYVGFEFNGDWESDGDMEVLIAPILLYEAPSWAFEATYGLPIYEDVQHRPITDYTISVGFRFLF